MGLAILASIALSVWLSKFALHSLGAAALSGVSEDPSADGDDDPHDQGSHYSDVLQSLFSAANYDKTIRPSADGNHTVVDVQIMIRSVGAIEEMTMRYKLECYFRQLWTDERLVLDNLRNLSHAVEGLQELSLSYITASSLWKPDTYFVNGKRSFLHSLTVPNRLLRIKRSGKVLYSMRLTIEADCYMDLRKYPLDNQSCPLYIGSYAYNADEMLLRWRNGKDQAIEYENIVLSQFTFTGFTAADASTRTVNHSSRSILVLHLHFKRNLGYYLLQIYIPSYMIVIVSWSSFWFHKEVVAGRVTLGTTSLLTITALGQSGRTGMPRLEYSTAVDIFLHTCFVFIFLTLVEYAIVNCLARLHAVVTDEPAFRSLLLESTTPRPPQLQTSPSEFCIRRLLNGHMPSCVRPLLSAKGLPRLPTNTETYVRWAEKVDFSSRLLFPATFIVINICYWTYYTSVP